MNILMPDHMKRKQNADKPLPDEKFNAEPVALSNFAVPWNYEGRATLQKILSVASAKILLLALVVFLSVHFEAAARNEHLEPDQLEELPPIVQRYYDNVFPLLHSGFSDVRRACYTVLPSFGPEYAWSMEEQAKDEYFLIINTLTKSFWYTGSREISTRHIKINQSLYKAVVELFLEVTRQIRKPDAESYMLDGVTYYFAAAGDGGNIITGSTHSPDKGSLMGRLVDVCENLKKIDDGNVTSRAVLEKEIRDLFREIRK